jgi:hypothetical protein
MAGKKIPGLAALVALALAIAGSTSENARAVLPSGNTAAQWNQIAEDTVVGSGAFQIEGFIYMAYESTAVYDATVALQGGYTPLLPAFRVWKKASPDAAIVEAARSLGCGTILSEDLARGARYGGVRVENPFALG